MKIPKRLQPLLEDGLIDYVIKPLRSGKEADVFVVVASGEVRCAKIYKEKTNRSFHNQVLYQEGRHTKNSRSSRAMGKHTRYGKQVEEEEWQNAEVDTLFKLHAAGVCVPIPYICISGVLIMELLLDQDGQVAPRIGDIEFDPEEARYCHDYLLREVIRMLLAGVVHADLSEFNICMTYNGPVIIDFPQAVDATSNNNAQYFLERDVRNLTHYFGRFAPEILTGNYGLEIWQHYTAGTLSPEMELTGIPQVSTEPVNLGSVFREIEEAREDALRKAARLSGIDPDETDDNDMESWFEPKRKKRTYTEPTTEASPTSPNRSENRSSHKQQNKKEMPRGNQRVNHTPSKPSPPSPKQPSISPKVEIPAFSVKRSISEKQTHEESPVQPKPAESAPIQWGRR